MRSMSTGRLSRIVLALPLLAASSFTPLHANSNEGWFEVSRGKTSNPVYSAFDGAPLADDALLPDTESVVFAQPAANGWQAVPILRHERLANQPIPEFSNADKPSVSAPPAAMVVTPEYPPVASRPVAPRRTVNLKTDSIGTSVPRPTAEALVLSRGEIQELTRQAARPAVLTEEQQADVRQQLRNRLPSSAVSTINLDMFAGEVKVLGKVDVDRVAIGNGDIVRADVLKTGELLIIGESEGSTSLRLWHSDSTQSDYNIRVSSSDPETRVRMETMVRMRVRMIEFRKSALGKLGIKWSDSATGPGLAIAGDAVGNNLFRLPAEELAATLPNTVKPFSTYFGVASSITSRINFLASTGDATTLAEPVLSTTNGGSASFLAGGEVPYPSVGANGQTVVQFKEYGIKLNVTPRIDASGNVRTLVETEISQLDPAVSVQGTPGLLTRRAQTQVNVRSGETIVISGLLSSESSKDVDKLPGIGNLPIIGSFFRSKNARNSVSELVIFVTPEIIEPDTALLTQREQLFLHNSEQRLDQAHGQIRLLD